MIDAVPDTMTRRQRIGVTAVLTGIVALLYAVPALAIFPTGLVDGPAWPAPVNAAGLTLCGPRA